MRHALTLAALLTALAQSSTAGDAPGFEWTQEKFDLVAAADSADGEAVAEKYRCRKCHNDTGVSDDEDVPTIAGQRPTYIYKQLTDFKNEVRSDKDMQKVAKKLSEQDMVNIAAWYSQQQRPAMVGGDAPLVVKICDSCHEKDIVEKDDRIEVAPVITGQVRKYLRKSMQAFKQADRSNDLFSRMQSVSHKLNSEEITRLARYYGALEPDVD